jgi:RNA polymerase sigma-70 factor (ECF subfamily)
LFVPSEADRAVRSAEQVASTSCNNSRGSAFFVRAMNSEGFQIVVREQKNRVFAYAAMLLRNQAEAQDVVQESMVRLWQNQSKVDQSGAPMWLKRTAHNLCIDRIRRRKVRSEVGTEQLEATSIDTSPGPDRVAESDRLGREIEQALGKLSEQDRSVLILREVQERPYAEIAEMLALPMGTLKARLHRAREQLRKKLIRAGVTP